MLSPAEKAQGPSVQKSVLFQLLPFPPQQIPIEIYLTLHDGNEGNKVLELTHTVLPLEEQLESSLALRLKFLVDARGISPGEQTSVLGQEIFNSFRSHG
jgi:hypothetical protein